MDGLDFLNTIVTDLVEGEAVHEVGGVLVEYGCAAAPGEMCPISELHWHVEFACADRPFVSVAYCTEDLDVRVAVRDLTVSEVAGIIAHWEDVMFAPYAGELEEG